MLFFLTALASPFFPQEGIILEDSYFQEADSEGEIDDATTFLAFNSAENPSGGVMETSLDSSKASDEEVEESKQQADSNIDAEQSDENNEEADAEASPQQISLAMEKEFGEMRMVQLANSIAGDMGMITKVTLEK